MQHLTGLYESVWGRHFCTRHNGKKRIQIIGKMIGHTSRNEFCFTLFANFGLFLHLLKQRRNEKLMQVKSLFTNFANLRGKKKKSGKRDRGKKKHQCLALRAAKADELTVPKD